MVLDLRYQKHMNKITIKTQLTIWYTITIFIISSALFLGFYYLIQKALISETDRSLTTHATEIVAGIGPKTISICDAQAKEIVDSTQSEIPGIFLTMTDITGFDALGNNSNEFQDIASEAISKNKPLFSNKTVKGINLRFIAQPVVKDGRVIGALVMGHPIDIYQQALQELKGLAALLIALFVFPSIIAGYFFAKNATKPIVNLTSQMQRINLENLNEKVIINSGSSETYNLVKNFNGLLDRMNEAFNRERQFIGEVAHEIKAPLSVIKSNAEVTLSKNRNETEYKSSLSQILTHVDRLTKRLVGLIDYAWAQSVDIERHFSKVNLTKLLEEICENATYLASSKEIKLDCELQNDVYVSGKNDKLFQVFLNIIDNAVKFTPKGGKISVKLYTNELVAVTEIKDNGVGIAKKDIETIFNTYSRGSNYKSSGFGLGLAIAKSITEAHNGKILVKSKENQGSLFIVTLPKLTANSS